MEPAELGLEALDLVPEAVVVLDDERAVVAVNERARTLLGLGAEHIGMPIGKALRVLDDTDQSCGDGFVPARNAMVDRLAERTYTVDVDGRRRPVAMSGRWKDDGIVLTFRHAGRRERVDMAASDLVATVSHEIRSPLTSVKGFTRTMLSKWDRFSDEQKRTMLETINEDADRVTRLLTELLDVSRIDAGRVQLHRSIIDVTGLVERVVDRARHRPEGRRRTVTATLADDVPRIHADPDKIEQIATNLLDNALKYAPEGEVAVDLRRVGDEVELTVADHGPGIPLEQQRFIFEKFGRGRGQRRAGTGLGLYITRGLVRAHGGQVWCESTDGDGATFHVRLPVDGDEPFES